MQNACLPPAKQAVPRCIVNLGLVAATIVAESPQPGLAISQTGRGLVAESVFAARISGLLYELLIHL